MLTKTEAERLEQLKRTIGVPSDVELESAISYYENTMSSMVPEDPCYRHYQRELSYYKDYQRLIEIARQTPDGESVETPVKNTKTVGGHI